MDHGPVPSQTYNLISGALSDSQIWDEFISDRSNHQIALRKEPEIDELSRAELNLLDEVLKEFGTMDRWALSEETHKFPEWKNPHGSALPISLEDILSADKGSAEEIDQILEELEALAVAEHTLKP